MREVLLTDTLVHEYTEYEWQDKLGDNPEDELLEIQHTGVVAAEKAGMRFFQVLVKPADELLSDTKPRNALTVDTWKYRARIQAQRYSGTEAQGLAATIALLARLADAQFAAGPDQFVVQVPGYGRLAFDVPYGGDYDELFKHLPEVESGQRFTPVKAEDIIEAVFLHDRKHEDGKRTGS